MGNLIATYLGIAGALLFAYLVLSNGDKSVNILGALKDLNIGTIQAFQGR